MEVKLNVDVGAADEGFSFFWLTRTFNKQQTVASETV